MTASLSELCCAFCRNCAIRSKVCCRRGSEEGPRGSDDEETGGFLGGVFLGVSSLGLRRWGGPWDQRGRRRVMRVSDSRYDVGHDAGKSELMLVGLLPLLVLGAGVVVGRVMAAGVVVGGFGFFGGGLRDDGSTGNVPTLVSTL